MDVLWRENQRGYLAVNESDSSSDAGYLSVWGQEIDSSL